VPNAERSFRLHRFVVVHKYFTALILNIYCLVSDAMLIGKQTRTFRGNVVTLLVLPAVHVEALQSSEMS